MFEGIFKKEKELKKYSYIKKPFAKNGWYAFFTSLMVLLLTFLTISMSVRMAGQTGMLSGALGLSCLLFSLMACFFAFLGIKEQEKNHAFAYAGAVIGGLLFIFWIGLIIAGAL
ncbi:MAG TPA: hypothetical protein IAB09_02725 [Candidatus Avilachnospira avicola]|nr:hypothetical protein [Candidatus Avilachnospira avicola]